MHKNVFQSQSGQKKSQECGDCVYSYLLRVQQAFALQKMNRKEEAMALYNQVLKQRLVLHQMPCYV